MRKTILGVPIDDYSLKEIVDFVASGRRIQQIFVNIHKIILFHTDEKMKELLAHDDCIFSVDGRWAQWCSYLSGLAAKQRFGGLEAIQEMCALSQNNGLRIYFFGSTKPTLDQAVNILLRAYPGLKLAGARDGFCNNFEEALLDIRATDAEAVFLALPSPQKELFGGRVFKEIGRVRYICGVGGAFDIIAGKVQRAPLILQNLGLEWFYRCLKDPLRLFPRYFFDFFRMLSIIIAHAFKRAHAYEK